MTTKKEIALNEIDEAITNMANLVLAQMSDLEKLINMGEDDPMELTLDSIYKKEKEIDGYEVEVSDRFVNTIVLYQPMATDLRRLIAIYRLSINLERIGDLAINIARTIQDLRGTREFKSMASLLNNMFLSCSAMVQKSLLSFINSDMDYAIWTIRNDEVIDEMNRKMLIGTIEKSKLDEKTKASLLTYTELKNTISNIERIADHATNIAEVTIYNMKGTDVRHSDFHLEDNDETQKG